MICGQAIRAGSYDTPRRDPGHHCNPDHSVFLKTRVTIDENDVTETIKNTFFYFFFHELWLISLDITTFLLYNGLCCKF